MSKKKRKKVSPLLEVQKLFSFPSQSAEALSSNDSLSAQLFIPFVFDDNQLDNSGDQWVKYMMDRNLSINEFNQEFVNEGWSLSIKEGSYSKVDDEGNRDNYTGMILELRTIHKGYPIEFIKYNSENFFIPSEIYEAIVYF